MMNPPHGKAKDYAPGEESYREGSAQRSIYREGYSAGEVGADAGHNPYTGKTPRAIWEAGRARARAAAVTV